MHLRIALLVTTLVAAPAAAQQSSMLDRGDVQLSVAQGVIQNITGQNIDAGFNMIDVASPSGFAAASGSGVATPRLAYVLYPDLDASQNVVLSVRRSTDGGRNWDPPIPVYTADTPGGEDLNTGDEGTEILAFGDEVYVTFHTNAHDKTQGGQSLWVVASADQGLTWSPPLNVSTGWNRGPGLDDYDVDEADFDITSTGLHLVWEADLEDPANPGNGYATPNNNENLYYARVDFSGAILGVLVPETALTFHPVGGADVDQPTIAAQDNVLLIAWVDDSFGSLAPGGNATVSVHSFDIGITFSSAFVHSGLVPGTFTTAWAQPRRPWALLDGNRAFVIQEDSRFDEDDVWMDRGDLDQVNQTINWNISGVMCNYTSTLAGTGDVDGIIAAVHDGVLAIMYKDDSAGTALNNSNEAYLVVDQNSGDDFIAGTFQRHMVTTATAAIYDLEVRGNMIAGVYETCPTNEEGGIVLSHDRGTTIDAFVFTTLGACSGGPTDVDDLRVALTLNGDFNVIYADERLGGPTGGNSNNAAWVTGGKYPRISYDAANLTLLMDRVDPRQSNPGGLAFLMISGSTIPGVDVPASVGLPGAGRGYFVGLNNDLLYNLMWANAATFGAGIAPTGASTWRAVPNASALFGITIYIVGGTLDIPSALTDPFRSFTDPILQ